MAHRDGRTRRLRRRTPFTGTGARLPCPQGVPLPRAVKLDRHSQWLILLVIWSGVGFMLMIQLQPQVNERFFFWAHGQQLARALLWGLLTPVVLHWREKWPLSGAGAFFGWLKHLAVSTGIMVVFVYVRLVAAHFLFGNDLDWASIWQTARARNLIDFMFYWSIVAVGWVISLNVRRQRAEVHEAQLLSQLASAELAALKQQLQPHFLFNCLNAISALMRDGQVDRAVDALAKLSGLMRALMRNSGVQEVELAREIDYVQRYLDLERLRFDDRLEARFDLDDDTLPLAVPTLLLQPIVENAIKHGIAGRRAPGRITIRARCQRGRLVLEVENDPAERGVAREKPEGQGVGLPTTRNRLAKMFGADYGVETTFAPGAPTLVRLTLPARASNSS